MPFDEEEDDNNKLPELKTGIKKASSQKSIFDSMPKKTSSNDFKEQVKQIEEKNIGYKKTAAELSIAFKKLIADKTLSQNRNIFMNETEQEVLSKLISLGSDINEDPVEKEGIGSLMIIILLLKTCLYQRDRINSLEYSYSQLEKKSDYSVLKSTILKEILVELDKKKISG